MLKSGFARIDITPEPECDLLGYEFRQEKLPRGNAGPLDPLYARALVLDDGSGPTAIVSLDLCILLVPLARRMRAAVAQAIGAPVDRVMICCSHTHSGPFPQRPEDGESNLLSTFVSPDGVNADVAYARLLEERIVEAAARAAGLMCPVTLAAQEAPCGIAYTRRVPTPDGVRLCWNPHEFPDLRPAPSADPMMTVVAFRQVAGPRQVLLWSVGCHPVTLGKTSRVVSADWPGAACAQLEAQLPGTDAMFVLGACGDTHPWIATQDSPAALQTVGRAASGTAALLAHALHAPAGLRDPENLSIKTLSRTVTFGKDELDLMAWKIGPLTIATAPVELFSQLSADLRHKIAGPLVVATNTNGWTGYWPTREAFAEGDYEVNAARANGRQPGDSERLIDELESLVGELG